MTDAIIAVVILCAVMFVIAFYADRSCRKMIQELQVSQKMLEEKAMELDGLNKEAEALEAQYVMYVEAEENLLKTKTEYFDLAGKLEKQIWEGESDKKIAYLTFDDGPYYLSSSFLDVLDEYDVPATFFYLMKGNETGYYNENEAYDAIYRRILSSGHTLGNHTATHKLGPEGVYRSVGAFMDDLLRNRDFIWQRYGYLTDIMRFPGGSYTSSLTDDIIIELRGYGYGYVDWNCSCGDGGAVLSPESFRDNILYHTSGRAILVVLMHDYSRNTLIALPEIIEGLRAQGYIFLPLFHDSIMVRK